MTGELYLASASTRIAWRPDARRLRLFAYWGGLAGAAFIAVYPILNWFTAARSTRFHLYLPWELGVPFEPGFIWAYLSLYVLILLPLFVLPADHMPALGKQLIAGTLVSGMAFLLFPAELGFVRMVPSEPLYSTLYGALFGVDRPHNLVPSLHVVWSACILLACIEVLGCAARAVLYLWLVAVMASTVFVHQHHITDVLTAAILVFVLRRCYRVPHA